MPINIGSITNVFGTINRAVSNVSSVRSFGDNLSSVFSTLLGGTGNGENQGGYTFEQTFAILTPFQFPANATGNHPLAPIAQSGGLRFPYNPTISEGVSVKYDNIELTHSNEAYYAYRGTDNVRITISDATWTCDTLHNAVYALSALHFFRSYSFMDFGRGQSGRPPSPMWFSAYGNYAFNRIPVLMEKADWSFPSDVDYVGVPEFGSPEFLSGILQTNTNASGSYTWLPVKFTVSNISLIVQHAPQYWVNFNLDDYYSGAAIKRGKSPHMIGPSPGTSTTSVGGEG